PVPFPHVPDGDPVLPSDSVRDRHTPAQDGEPASRTDGEQLRSLGNGVDDAPGREGPSLDPFAGSDQHLVAGEERDRRPTRPGPFLRFPLTHTPDPYSRAAPRGQTGSVRAEEQGCAAPEPADHSTRARFPENDWQLHLCQFFGATEARQLVRLSTRILFECEDWCGGSGGCAGSTLDGHS